MLRHKQYVNITIQFTCNEMKSLHHRRNNHMFQRSSSVCHEQMCHAYDEEHRPEKSFFRVEAFRWSIWSTRYLLATGLKILINVYLMYVPISSMLPYAEIGASFQQ